MRGQGSTSWRFGHNIDQSLHLVLYVRDGLGLDVGRDPINPPRLVGPVVDHRHPLDDDPTEAVVSQWSSWWHDVVGLQATGRSDPPVEQMDHRAWHDELTARHHPVFDPPTWSCLDGSPQLQDVVRAVWVEAFRQFTAAGRCGITGCWWRRRSGGTGRGRRGGTYRRSSGRGRRRGNATPASLSRPGASGGSVVPRRAQPRPDQLHRGPAERPTDGLPAGLFPLSTPPWWANTSLFRRWSCLAPISPR